jgi:hypothetical protein
VAAGASYEGLRSMSAPVLSQQQLNRALLARQLLLERAQLTSAEAIEHLVGMQAQSPNSPYVGLWTRVDGFRFEGLSELVAQRQVARLALMRSTIHLVTAADAHRLRTLVAPVLQQGFHSSQFAKLLTGLEVELVVAAGRAAVVRRPLTFAELGAELQREWPTYDHQALAQVIRAHVPLVQVPPRGMWGKNGQARHTSLEAWLGPSPTERGSRGDLVLRYLASFGPASVADMQKWSGLTRLGAVVVKLAPQLITFRNERGAELFDLPDAPRPPADIPAPVRYLAEFDNALLSHADRTRIISEEDKARLFTKNGIIPGAVLVDGMVRALWRIERPRSKVANVELSVLPFRRLSKRDGAAVIAEGHRLLAAVAPETDSREVIVKSG